VTIATIKTTLVGALSAALLVAFPWPVWADCSGARVRAAAEAYKDATPDDFAEFYRARSYVAFSESHREYTKLDWEVPPREDILAFPTCAAEQEARDRAAPTVMGPSSPEDAIAFADEWIQVLRLYHRALAVEGCRDRQLRGAYLRVLWRFRNLFGSTSRDFWGGAQMPYKEYFDADVSTEQCAYRYTTYVLDYHLAAWEQARLKAGAEGLIAQKSLVGAWADHQRSFARDPAERSLSDIVKWTVRIRTAEVVADDLVPSPAPPEGFKVTPETSTGELPEATKKALAQMYTLWSVSPREIARVFRLNRLRHGHAGPRLESLARDLALGWAFAWLEYRVYSIHVGMKDAWDEMGDAGAIYDTLTKAERRTRRYLRHHPGDGVAQDEYIAIRLVKVAFQIAVGSEQSTIPIPTRAAVLDALEPFDAAHAPETSFGPWSKAATCRMLLPFLEGTVPPLFPSNADLASTIKSKAGCP